MRCDNCGKHVTKLKRDNETRKFLCEECSPYYEENYVFRSFFDQSMGMMIDSPFKKREIEKEYGVTYISNDERIALTKQAKRNIKANEFKRHRKNIENIFERVSKGHSYIQELKGKY